MATAPISTPSPAFCFSSPFFGLISSLYSRSCPPSLSCRSVSTSSHPFPACKFGSLNDGFRTPRITQGKSTIVSPLKVASCLPNSDGSSPTPNVEVQSSGSLKQCTAPGKLNPDGRVFLNPFRGKSGCISFSGLSYELAEASKLVSSPFEDGKGSAIWFLAPLALLSSLLLPQFFLYDVLEALLKNEVLIDIAVFLFSEFIFYIGLGVFLWVTNHIQRPYTDFSAKQWSLITGLKGYMYSAFLTMGFKVIGPFVAVYIVWPVIPFVAAVSVAPFLLGCATQFAFELYHEKQATSCWPVLPIIFEVYRLYQLNRGAYFVEKLMRSIQVTGAQMTPKAMAMGNAFGTLIVIFQILAFVCLWSLATFLVRLFPSRPVVENY